VQGKVGAHGSDENFGVCHHSILAGSAAGPIYQERGGGFKEGLQHLPRFIREPGFVQRARHQQQPTVAGCLSDSEGRVADPQPRMAALFDVSLGTAETADEEIAEPLFRALQIVRRIQGPEYFVAGDLPIKRVGQAFESGLADG